MQIVKDYRDNKVLRDSFNELAKKVFDLDFEGWYQNGFWNENYIPYSVVIDGKVVANVSVNRCDMNYNGRVLKLIQLGTVMTDPDYRGKGYARTLMENIMQEYEGRTDGMFLYANDSVLTFYLKFGFYEKAEYQYSKPVKNSTGDVTKKFSMDDVIASFGSAIRRATLFFMPIDRRGYEETVVDEADTTFFVKGKAFETIGDDKFMIQAIAHA